MQFIVNYFRNVFFMKNKTTVAKRFFFWKEILVLFLRSAKCNQKLKFSVCLTFFFSVDSNFITFFGWKRKTAFVVSLNLWKPQKLLIKLFKDKKTFCYCFSSRKKNNFPSNEKKEKSNYFTVRFDEYLD